MAYIKTFLLRSSLLVSCFFLCLFSRGQENNSYAASWERIDTLLEKSGLAKTALREVNAIYSDAKKKGNDVQVIKALLYTLRINDQVSEDADVENIRSLEQEIAVSKQPARSILSSIAAGRYYHYLQLNRARLYNRTPVSGMVKEDIATWDLSDLYAKITSLYEASIADAGQLKKISLEPFDPIIVKGNARHLRPTLFDLLAYRAVEYFQNDERYVRQPAYSFELTDASAFADASVFAAHSFSTRDTSSLHYKALLLYQDLIRFHLNDPDPAALIDADLNRIRFANNFGVGEKKEELYRQALEHIVLTYEHQPASSEALYLLAEWYTGRARQYDPLRDSANRYAYTQARELCESCLELNDSLTAGNCDNLLKEILRKDLRMQAEKVNPPGEPFRVFVNYRNFTTTHFRIIRFDQQTRERIGGDNWDQKFWEAITRLPAVKSFSYTFPDTKDHQLHGVEIKIDPLPVGMYAILASPDENFSLQSNTLALQYVYVSDIAYVNNDNTFYVLNRRSGAPLASARVQLWREKYDYRQKKSVLEKTASYTTDKQGYFAIKDTAQNRENRNLHLEISYGSDRLFLNDPIYSYYYYSDYSNEEGNGKDRTFLFSDRSIYRPGQTVYFKGIVVTTPGKDHPSTVVPGQKTIVALFDENDQQVDSVALTTNAFGSYAGKFTLPAGRLNGNFSIRDENNDSRIYIRMEEYKRPRFAVELARPEGSYRLGDTVTVAGTAKAYAGNTINSAQVSFRVVRTMLTPLWAGGSYLPRIWPPYPQQQMEITHGTTETDENGKFTIPFRAIPDNKVPEAQNPLFHYEVTTDVTDLNGETRSSRISVSVGYHALKLGLDIPAFLETDSFRQVSVSSTNMNDVFEPAKVNISIYPLKAPSRIFRERYWQQPDQFIMSREAYYRLFPYDQYADETDITRWEKGEKVFERSFTTAPDSSAGISGVTFKAGWYAVEAVTQDRYGDTVKAIRYVRLDDQQKIVSPLATARPDINRQTARPGDNIRYGLSTNLGKVYAVYEFITSDGEKRNIFSLTGKQQTQERKITEKYLGEIAVNMFFVKNNRVYSTHTQIEVPFYSKKLDIAYTHFRDKTLPGAEERWKVKISGHEGEKVAAEVLTALYDASLDEFLPHSWKVPDIWNRTVSHNSWEAQANFSAWNSYGRSFEDPGKPVIVKVYDRLNTPDETYALRSLSYRTGGIVALDAQAAPLPKKAMDGEVIVGYSEAAETDYDSAPVNKTPEATPVITPRANLRETAFFFPALYTDSSGNVEFSFTAPEALTKWKWLLLAHTRDLAFGYGEKTMVTQKQLMVQPNAPRFLREGDKINFSTKVVNMTTREISGTVSLHLVDPATGEIVDAIFHHLTIQKSFTAKPGQSIAADFPLEIPASYARPVTWRIIASASAPDSSGNNSTISDGEEAYIPVISNRTLVTETLPLPVSGKTSASFRFDKLLNAGKSKSLEHHALTVEFTSNPSWYAVQALPYLTASANENAEAVFNRYYANALASKIAGSSPRLTEIMEKWKTSDSSAFLSNLEKNEALKSVVLQETPWVLEARSESEQKRNLALLFDPERMSPDLDAALGKLIDMQSPGGGFVWFKGGPEDRYMTQYILSGIGHLKQLGAIPSSSLKKLEPLIHKGIAYLDQQLKKDYDELLKLHSQPPAGTIDRLSIYYLYMRSFFTDLPVPGDILAAYNYYRDQSKTAWVKQNTFLRGMIALSLQRSGDNTTAKKIMAALKETAIHNKELGMYWKDMTGGYYWYQAPVETQSVMIEAFSGILKDMASVDLLKVWLLKNKQTNNWKTSKSTADACYALLLQGSDWTGEAPQAEIRLGEKTIVPESAEAGTGYFKLTIPADEIKPSMGNISVKLTDGKETPGSPSWGAIYWQYFEDLDKISSASTPLKLDKKLFVEKNSDRGPVLHPLRSDSSLRIGDKIKVRIELRADRDLEYVHMKDMRASAFEPVNVISSYKWQGGLGYYESTKDASADFFFTYLPKGVYVFEYSLFATHTGSFSNGITTIQCMYAPEFSSHSEGITVNIARQ